MASPVDTFASPPGVSGVPAGPRPGVARRTFSFFRRLGPAGPIALAVAGLPTVGAACLLGTLTVLAPALRETRRAPVLCALAFTLLGGLSLLPTYALSILAGWAFGFALGFPTALSGIVGASLVAYAVARFTSGRRFVNSVDGSPAWRAVHAALLGGGFWRSVWVITLLRLAPFPPFSVTNLMMGAMHAKLSRYLTGTTLGLAPYAGALVLAGAGLQQFSWRAADQPWLLVAGAVTMLATIFVIGRAAKRALESAAQTDAPPTSDGLTK